MIQGNQFGEITAIKFLIYEQTLLFHYTPDDCRNRWLDFMKICEATLEIFYLIKLLHFFEVHAELPRFSMCTIQLLIANPGLIWPNYSILRVRLEQLTTNFT